MFQGGAPSQVTYPFAAAAQNNVQVIRNLVGAGVPVDSRDPTLNNSTPLAIAALHGNADAVTALLLLQADSNTRDANRMTPLMYAVRRPLDELSPPQVAGRGAVIDALVKAGAVVNHSDSEGLTALHYASRFDDVASVRRLISVHRASPDPQNRNRQTPMFIAASSGSIGAVRALVGLGANREHRDEDQQTPLMFALVGGVEIVRKMLQLGGFNLNSTDASGRTALCHAVIKGCLGSVEALVAGGGAVDAPNSSGQTPLRYAVEMGRVEIVKFLVQRGADPLFEDTEGYSPIEAAVKKATVPVANALLHVSGASAGATNPVLLRMFYLATKFGNADMVRLALSYNVPVDAVLHCLVLRHSVTLPS